MKTLRTVAPDYGSGLDRVREMSENATLRASGKTLACRPYLPQETKLKPVAGHKPERRPWETDERDPAAHLIRLAVGVGNLAAAV